MIIRKAQSVDVSKLRSLILRAADRDNNPDFDARGWERFLIPNSEAAIAARITDGDYIMLCCVQEDALPEANIIGLISLYKLDKIDQLFVHPAHFRKGIATSLWRAAKLLSEEQGCQSFYVKSSTQAIAVYRSFGFKTSAPSATLNGMSFTLMTYD
ncbi:MAG: hypothetical protein COC19_02230 [SAR86 cluster bacterium]|uniref:N-acetyltransferase domain-containing protein n=1 Tax=SAR86 cluster bacterium TaxID=2030880 RepID=A0A2A4MSR6_9GAMM|nr:MAG: hypothetical protein COC19_02230 [SAR86 cluster bacterium]